MVQWQNPTLPSLGPGFNSRSMQTFLLFLNLIVLFFLHNLRSIIFGLLKVFSLLKKTLCLLNESKGRFLMRDIKLFFGGSISRRLKYSIAFLFYTFFHTVVSLDFRVLKLSQFFRKIFFVQYKFPKLLERSFCESE